MSNTTKLQDLITSISTNKICLPDFQRQFVWSEIEQQKKLVASVITRMPLGSLLELEAGIDEYAYKKIGCKNREAQTGQEQVVKFLLDGQQRMTVLTNVFSDVIFKSAGAIQNLVSQSLKRRFFIKIPSYENLSADKDLFGAKNLQFPMQDPENDVPNFLTSAAFSLIEHVDFKSGDGSPFNPYTVPVSYTNIHTKCLESTEYYLIPLFLFADPNANTLKEYLKRIISGIAEKFVISLVQKYTTEIDKESYVKSILSATNFEYYENGGKGEEVFKIQLGRQAQDWGDAVHRYIKSCVDNVQLAEIVLKGAERERAIDIYENLNMGGVSLDIFDLILAKVAKVFVGNFNELIVSHIEDDISGKTPAQRASHVKSKYPYDLLPEGVEGLFVAINDYNASKRMMCLDKDGNLSKIFIESFLNVLSLRYHIVENNKEVSVDLTKREAKLQMTPEFINNNCRNACKAIDRALYFFNSRCGIRSITEVNYKLMIDIVAYILWDNNIFKNKKVHKLLDAWYWASLFAGEFDKDQNAQLALHLKKLIETIADINNQEKKQWLLELKNDVLSVSSFANEDLLLYTNAAVTEKIPKEFLSSAVCQYYLSKTYPCLFDNKHMLSAFDKDNVPLEKHHIIPLGSTTSVKQSSKDIRKDKFHILNSPLNKIYITKSDNLEISDDSLQDYSTRIVAQSIAALNFPLPQGVITMDAAEIINTLRTRYVNLKGDIQGRITRNLT